MDQIDIEIAQPLAAHRAFLPAINAASGLRVARPEHHHFGILKTILDRAKQFAAAHTQAPAPVVKRAPIPAFPTVGIVVHFGGPDGVHKTQLGAQVVANIAPVVMRAIARRDRPGAVIALHPLDLGRNNIQRLIPADAFVSRDATILDIAFPVGIKVDPLHRVLQPVRRVDHRLPVQPVG